MLWEGLLILLEDLCYSLELVFLIVWKPIIIITIFWGIIQTTLVASEYIHMVEKNGKRYYIDKSLYGSSKYVDYYEYKNIFFRSFESDFCEFVAE